VSAVPSGSVPTTAHTTTSRTGSTGDSCCNHAGKTGASGLDLQVTWEGWIAAIRPSGTRLPERRGTILAAVAAAPFAVTSSSSSSLGTWTRAGGT
jgi:hypothetical protein